MSAKRRKGHGAEHENAERWLLTYADMITLLMAFFIMLYSMSQIDIKKFQAMASAVRAELGGKGAMPGGQGVTRAGSHALKSPGFGLAPRSEGAAQLAAAVGQLAQAGPAGLQVVESHGSVVLRVPDTALLFAPGSADLTPAMRNLLLSLAVLARRRNCTIRAEGHTDNVPISSARYASNWELSAARAEVAVLCLAREGGLPPNDLAAMGYADSRPLAPNTSDANRRRNRRVEFVLSPRPGADPAPAAASPLPTAGAPGQPLGLQIDLRPLPVDLSGGAVTTDQATGDTREER